MVTNNIEAALILGETEGTELHLTGGVWRANDRDMVGPEAMRYFEKFHATHAVVGAGGLHPTSGALDFSYEDAQVTRTILQNSRRRYLAADVSKWTRSAAVRVASLSEFTCFVTDALPPQSTTAQSLKESGVEIVVCD